MKTNELLIHVIEDDFGTNKIIQSLLKKMNFANIKTYKSAKWYMDSEGFMNKPDMVIVDYHLDNNIIGTTIIELIQKYSRSVEIVLISSDDQAISDGKLQSHIFASIYKNSNLLGNIKKAVLSITSNLIKRYNRKALKMAIALFFVIDIIVISSLLIIF